MSVEFPAELEHFIAQNIESLAQLEALLLLHKDPDRQWDCASLSQQLYISPDMCGGIVGDLERRGFIGQVDEGRFRYHAPAAEADRLISELDALYQQRRVAVITLIYSKPVKKVQTFADAFRLRKEE